MATEGDIITIKQHTKYKYDIIRKYAFEACAMFARKYKNFVYIDTHGGSGRIILPDGQTGDGSILIMRHNIGDFPMHVIEIDTGRYSMLVESTEKFRNIKTYYGDCNEIIDQILKKIPSWKFFLCFIDPDGLIYPKNGKKHMQLVSDTVRKIGRMNKSEVIVNFPLAGIERCGGCLGKDDRKKDVEYVNRFYGKNCTEECGLWKDCKHKSGECKAWQEIIRDPNPKKRRRLLLELYIDKNMSSYEYTGAFLVRIRLLNVPQYYLIYGTHHPVGAKIMRDTMRQEWGYINPPWVDFEKQYPLKRFIFG